AHSLHKPAADRVFEILYFIAICRPMERLRVSQAKHGWCLAKAFGILPNSTIAMTIRMTRTARYPALARHGWQGGAEEDFAADPLRSLGRIADFDRGQLFHVGSFVDADCEV